MQITSFDESKSPYETKSMADSIMVLKWSAPTMTKAKKQPLPSLNVIQLGPYDVLCDRSRLAFNHIGNRRFRITVETKVPSYAVATHKSDRSRIVRSIVSIIHGAGGRFLTRSNCGDWKEVSKVRSNEKVGHALRAAISARSSEEERTIYDVIGAVDAVDGSTAEPVQLLSGESKKRKLCEKQHDECHSSSNDTWLNDVLSMYLATPDFATSKDFNSQEMDNESNDTDTMLNELYEPDIALDSDDLLSLDFDPLFDDVDENVEMVIEQLCIGQYSHLLEELDDLFDQENEVNSSICGWALTDVAPCSS
jgi:hypothetical protein